MPDENNTVTEMTAPEPSTSFSHNLAVSFWGTVSIAIFCSVVVLSIGLAGYHRYAQTPMKLGVVDLNLVMELQQYKLYKQAATVKEGDAAKQAIYEDAQRFGQNLEAAIKAAKEACQCNLLVKTAVVLPDIPDYTHQLISALGLAGVTPDNSPPPAGADVLGGKAP